MKDIISNFFKILFGTDYPGLLSIWTKQTQVTKFFRNDQVEDLHSYITMNAKDNDLYFGCGLREDIELPGRGKSEDVIAIPGFWFDLDIKNSDAHKEENLPLSIEEALNILKGFPMEPTVINDSGHGLQVYWLFEKTWIFENANRRDLAARLSKKFQQTIRDLFAEHGYRLDNTSDLARVLRIPGTLNHKITPIVPVVNILSPDNEGQRRYIPHDFIKAIKICEEKARLNLSKRSFPENNGREILKRCLWFKHCQADSKDLSEPEWFYMLTVASFCKDAEILACELSRDYEGYDENETLEKVKRIQTSHNNPVSCAYVKSNFNNGCCDNCPHNVKSPFALGIDKSNSAFERIGFIYDDDGDLKSLNGNIFARYILQRFNLLYTSGERFYQYYDGVWNYLEANQLSRKLRDLLHEFVPDFWTTRWEDKYVEALKREAPFERSLNTNRNFINLENGMLDLSTYELKPHHPDFRSSIRVPILYNKDAECPHFNKFMLDIFDGDPERIRVVEEMLGYCLTSETSAQKAFLLYGKGANGKSLLAEIILNLCGKQNTSAIPLAELNNSFKRYELVGRLLNIATENEISPTGLDTAAFKTIVSGDAIQVEKKFEQPFMYQPICKLVFSLNNLPYSRDRSWGFQRRLIVIPFNRTFREDDPNTQIYAVLKDSLLAEMDGILNRALEGLKRLRQNGFRFSYSSAIVDLNNKYKQILNPYIQFVEEMIEQGEETDSISNDIMLKVFKRWCGANGHNKLGSGSVIKIHNEIRDAMRDTQLNFDCGKGCKTSKGRSVKGVRLKIENDQKPDPEFADLLDD